VKNKLNNKVKISHKTAKKNNKKENTSA